MLGLILSPLGQEVPGQYPNTVNYTGASTTSFLCPPDPGYNTRGEQAFFYDTALGGLSDGGIPTDTELGPVYGYTPVAGGWVNAQEAYYPSPWRPPGGWNPAGAYGPQPAPKMGKPLSGASGSTPTWLVLVVIAGLGVAGYWGYREFRKPVRA